MSPPLCHSSTSWSLLNTWNVCVASLSSSSPSPPAPARCLRAPAPHIEIGARGRRSWRLEPPCASCAPPMSRGTWRSDGFTASASSARRGRILGTSGVLSPSSHDGTDCGLILPCSPKGVPTPLPPPDPPSPPPLSEPRPRPAASFFPTSASMRSRMSIGPGPGAGRQRQISIAFVELAVA